MIRNGVDWSKVYVDATKYGSVHVEVIALLERKTGMRPDQREGCSIDCPLTTISQNGTKMFGYSHLSTMVSLGRKEMSISELAALPDYQPAKKMTVQEICEALGYDVEIVKGGE